MRQLSILAAIAVMSLAGGAAVAAEDKPQPRKEKKVCRTVEMPGRITPQKICRKIVVEEKAGAAAPKAPAGAGTADPSR